MVPTTHPHSRIARTAAKTARAYRLPTRTDSARHQPGLDNQALAHQLHDNRTGLPDTLKTGIENLSGLDLSDVRVHRSSSEPARLHAHALTRGSQIHLAPDQEHHLPHEAWHVVQQKQGRVPATTERSAPAMNADPALEQEATDLGRRAAYAPLDSPLGKPLETRATSSAVVQMAPNQAGTTNPEHLLQRVRELEAEGLSREEILDRISEEHATNANRYIYTDRYGWVDLRHLGAAASYGQSVGSVVAEGLGLGNELLQWATEWGDDYRSGFSPEDIPSNAAGAELGDDYVSDNEALSASIERWLDAAGARAQDDPLADRDELPPTDPAVRGGADRGSSNASRTQSTVSDNPPVNDFMDEWTRGLQALSTPQGWYRLFGY